MCQFWQVFAKMFGRSTCRDKTHTSVRNSAHCSQTCRRCLMMFDDARRTAPTINFNYQVQIKMFGNQWSSIECATNSVVNKFYRNLIKHCLHVWLQGIALLCGQCRQAATTLHFTGETHGRIDHFSCMLVFLGHSNKGVAFIPTHTFSKNINCWSKIRLFKAEPFPLCSEHLSSKINTVTVIPARHF